MEVIYRSKACLIQRDGEMPEAKQQLIDRLMTRIQGVIRARESKYIMLHAPSETDDRRAAAGRRTPDHSAAGRRAEPRGDAHGQQRNPVLGNHGKLKALGASSILVLPIER